MKLSITVIPEECSPHQNVRHIGVGMNLLGIGFARSHGAKVSLAIAK